MGSLIRQNKEKAALEIARLAVQSYPQSSRAHKTLGAMIKRTGNVDAARRTFLQALEVERSLHDPDSERLMDVQLQLWLLDQESKKASFGTEKESDKISVSARS